MVSQNTSREIKVGDTVKVNLQMVAENGMFDSCLLYTSEPCLCRGSVVEH